MFTTLRKFRPPNKLLAFLCPAAPSAPAYRHLFPSWVSNNRLIQRHPRLLCLEARLSLRRLRAILAFAIVSGLFRIPFVSSRLLLHASSFDLHFAFEIFRRMPSPNLFSWNTVIRAASVCENQQTSVAFSLYAEMLLRGKLPDKYTFPFLLKACRSRSDLNYGRLLHCHALTLGLSDDIYLQTALVTMYLSCGQFDLARYVFDDIPQKDVVLWTTVISGLVDNGCHEEALKVFNQMRMFDHKVCPNEVTVVSAMSAFVGLGSLELVKSLHAYAEKIGLEINVFFRNSLIAGYAKCGSVACAVQVFDRMGVKDLHSWTAMITALGSHGLGREAIEVYSTMCKMNVSPDSTTFIAVLSACSHSGLVDEGIDIFESMERFDVVPEPKHYGCVVDLLSRAGHLAQALEFVSRMPVRPTLAILGALLSACRVQNNLELGELVAMKIKELYQYKGGANVLLSNIYADQQQWQEVVSTREVARKEAEKPPAQSWI
ncbi:pentatricopeptide repeat-containing protein At2g02980, chloroplastic-like [Zingiber officinale]|uniref:Pentatricopeptide repeat-containing protein n=1 Tax=Zingiber officinale TaxID=94328 RepID=A0A8J5HTK3_ZINOF|nr:pentatricopeptide repeat-containing protein At2g02980, chloroplastic-like [Zingiber officinale]KAG6524809.1 hypothetical protein ZIOFF_014753 [Zingiber officinale]